MDFLKFLQRESKDFDRALLLTGAFAGVVSTMLIFILTAAANRAAAGVTPYRELVMIVLCLVGYWFAKGHLMQRTTEVVEEVIRNVRRRLAVRLRDTDLASFEAIGKAPFYNAISTHATAISRAAPAVVSAGTSIVLLLCAFIAIFFLSSASFLVMAATLGVIIGVLYLNRGEMLAKLARFTQVDNRFVKGFDDLLDGFKELKLHSEKNRDFFENHLNPMAEECREIRVDTGMTVNQSVMVASSALFLLLAALIFVIPVITPEDASKLVRISTLVVFIFGPLGEVVSVFPLVTEATNSIREINRIEAELDSLFGKHVVDPMPGKPIEPLAFDSIHCHQLAFEFRDEKGEPSFSLEPLDFELKKGELVFITGGNGSGKSTFLRVLAALYPPKSGSICVGDRMIGPDLRQPYRDLFSAVFADFHLFDEFYGLDHPDKEKLSRLLHEMDLFYKVTVDGKALSTTRLSTGQRKRLALIVALMEERPVLLLDEWAAEQDPQFRRKFYREILPELKRQGKTVVAVTHDDEYYGVADRVLKMQYGQFV